MHVASNGSVRRTAAEWTKIFTHFTESGLSRVEYCRQENIKLASFSRWKQKLGASKPKKNSFIEVTPRATTPASPVPEPRREESTSPWAVEIELASGTTLRLRG